MAHLVSFPKLEQINHRFLSPLLQWVQVESQYVLPGAWHTPRQHTCVGRSSFSHICYFCFSCDKAGENQENRGLEAASQRKLCNTGDIGIISARLWFAESLANSQCPAYVPGLAKLLKSGVAGVRLSWAQMCASSWEKLKEKLHAPSSWSKSVL